MRGRSANHRPPAGPVTDGSLGAGQDLLKIRRHAEIVLWGHPVGFQPLRNKFEQPVRIPFKHSPAHFHLKPRAGCCCSHNHRPNHNSSFLVLSILTCLNNACNLKDLPAHSSYARKPSHNDVLWGAGSLTHSCAVKTASPQHKSPDAMNKREWPVTGIRKPLTTGPTP